MVSQEAYDRIVFYFEEELLRDDLFKQIEAWQKYAMSKKQIKLMDEYYPFAEWMQKDEVIPKDFVEINKVARAYDSRTGKFVKKI